MIGIVIGILTKIPWGAVIPMGVKLVNWMIDSEQQKSEEKAATLAVLNTHMKGALNEIKSAKLAADAAGARVAADPGSLRDKPNPFNSDNHG